MMRWLSLDLATEAGVAYWGHGMPLPRAWILDLPEGASIGVWLAALYEWAIEFVNLEEITDISIETPLIGFGDENKNFKLISGYGVMCMVGATLGVSVSPIANSTMFTHWVGSNKFQGKERKARSVVAAQMRGFGKVSNHNIADTLGVLTCRLHMLGIKDVPWNIQKGMADSLFEGKGGTRITKQNEVASAKILNKALSFNRNAS